MTALTIAIVVLNLLSVIGIVLQARSSKRAEKLLDSINDTLVQMKLGITR